MNENRVSDYLDRMQPAATNACNFVEGLVKDDFLEDRRTQQAVILSLIIIGEAATKVMNDYADFAQAPWRSMRNRIAHGYFDINLDVVWDTVQTALPELIKQLTAIREGTETPTARIRSRTDRPYSLPQLWCSGCLSQPLPSGVMRRAAR